VVRDGDAVLIPNGYHPTFPFPPSHLLYWAIGRPIERSPTVNSASSTCNPASTGIIRLGTGRKK